MLRSRLMVGIPLALVLLASLLWPGVPGALLFLALAGAATALGLREFFGITRRMGLPGSPALATTASFLFLAATALTAHLPVMPGVQPPGPMPMVLTFILVAGFVEVFRRGAEPDSFAALFISLAGFVYVCWSLSFLAELYFSDVTGFSGRLLVVFIVTVTKVADTGAYCVGTWTSRRPGGNHRITPRLSPKKSWEGLAGGTAASVGCALVLAHYLRGHLTYGGVVLDLTAGRAAFLGLSLALLGFAGDLAESALKRGAGLKDSGSLPGLGGVLDVLDSLLFAAPFAYGCIRLAAAVSAPVLQI